MESAASPASVPHNSSPAKPAKAIKKKAGLPAVHARFLRTLALRLMAHPEVFRVLLGPGYPGHETHFRFDMTTFRMVQLFEDGKPLELPHAAPPAVPPASPPALPPAPPAPLPPAPPRSAPPDLAIPPRS